jgi:hypothetical protein
MANPNPSPATRIQPGTSGNPGGRPKFSATSDAMRRTLEGKTIPRGAGTVAEQLARAAIERARRKSDQALNTVLDRTEGTVAQLHELTGREGAPLFDPARLAALLLRREARQARRK